MCQAPKDYDWLKNHENLKKQKTKKNNPENKLPKIARVDHIAVIHH